jgi:hypothetical protein
VSPEGSPIEVADAISAAVAARDIPVAAPSAPSWDAVADAMLGVYERLSLTRGRSNGARPVAAPDVAVHR